MELAVSSAILIAWLALAVSTVSLVISILNFRRDRGRVSAEAAIRIRFTEHEASVGGEDKRVGRFWVKVTNVGRRPVTLEDIGLEVFADEVPKLRAKNSAATVREQAGVGFFAAFPQELTFPVSLKESEPIETEQWLPDNDLEAYTQRRRRALVAVIGRRRPLLFRCPVQDSST